MYRTYDNKDDRPTKNYGHPSLRKESKDDENQSENGNVEHDMSGKEAIEGKCHRVEFIRKQINKK